MMKPNVSTRFVPFRRSPGPSQASQNKLPSHPLNTSYTKPGRSSSMHWKPVGAAEHRQYRSLVEEYAEKIDNGEIASASYKSPRVRSKEGEDAVLAALDRR